jgi:hypothetical protein
MNFQKHILPFLPLAALVIAASIALVKHRQRPSYFKPFAFFWLFILLVEITGHILRWNKIHNHWLYNISYFATFLFLPWFFSRFPEADFLKKITPGYLISFSVFFLVEALFRKPFTQLLTTVFVAGGGIITLFSAAYLWQLYKSEEVKSIQSDPHFWMSIGFFFYYASLTPFLGMLNYLWQNFPEFTKTYSLIINYGFTILLNTLICVAYLCRMINTRK